MKSLRRRSKRLRGPRLLGLRSVPRVPSVALWESSGSRHRGVVYSDGQEWRVGRAALSLTPSLKDVSKDSCACDLSPSPRAAASQTREGSSSPQGDTRGRSSLQRRRPSEGPLLWEGSSPPAAPSHRPRRSSSSSLGPTCTSRSRCRRVSRPAEKGTCEGPSATCPY